MRGKKSKKPRTIVPENILHEKRMRKILYDHRQDPLIPMGKMMIAQLNHSRAKEKRGK